MELAGSLALTDSAVLHLVHAWEAFAERAMLSRGDISRDSIDAHVEKQYLLHQKELYQLGDALRNRIGLEAYDRLSPRFHLPRGQAKKIIADLAAELQADIVVMGTVARTGISGLIIGNTAETILDQLECSVLAIKPPGFSTP
jgi:universal stress protein E